MTLNAVAKVSRLYKFSKPDVLSQEGAHLPEAYKKFYREWMYATPSPVHFRHSTEIAWEKGKNGEMKRVDDFLIPLKYPPEFHKGLWGGEAVIKGFQKRQRFKQRVPHFWVPNLFKSAVYSEILDKVMEATVTNRTIDLILENYGFDNYILKTSSCDLKSGLALKLKRKMLHALYYKDLYPDNVEKQEEVYNKYKHYLDNYSQEDIEWFGLTIDEALKKYEVMNKSEIKPLKHELRLRLIEKLMSPPEVQDEDIVVPEAPKSSWVSKLNPFSKGSAS